jgi:hypothetical protein
MTPDEDHHNIAKLAMDRVMAAIEGGEPAVHSHFYYGGKHLVAWYLFRTDAEWEAAKGNGLIAEMERLTRYELLSGGCPLARAEEIIIAFTSEEDIQRETGGAWYEYFK